MSEATLTLLQQLRRRLHQAMRRQTAAEVAFGALVTAAVLASLLLAGAAVEAVLWMGVGLRSLWFWAFVLGALGLVGYFVVLPVLRLVGVVPGLDERAAARVAGARHPAVADRLTALLDLADGRASAAPSPFVDRAVQALGESVAPVPFERVEDLRPARRAAPWAVAPLLGLAAFFLAAPTTFVGAVDRLFEPSVDFAPPAPYRFDVAPGDVELARGEALTVEARPVGTALPPDAVLEVGRADEEALDRVRLHLEGGRFRHTVPNVRADLRYRVVSDEGVASAWFEAAVVERPVVRGLRVALRPPGYTGLPTRRLAPGVGDVLALPGTTVQVTVDLAGPPLKSAHLAVDWAGGAPQRVPLAVEDGRGTARFALRGEGGYAVRLVGENGRRNESPVVYRLDVLRDAPPQITLTEGADAALDAGARRAAFRITDDFGFSRVTLYWRLAERRDGPPDAQFQPVAIPLSAPRALDQEVLTRWLPSPGRPLQPGDVVEFFGEVRDNDAVGGYKRARTPVFALRFPSLDERFDRLEETQDAADEALDTVEDEADALRERFRELRDDLRRDPRPDWEDQRQLDQLQQQQESLQQQTQQLTEQMEQLLEQMQEGDLVTEETMRLYEAMQQVIDELDAPELREALERLQEAMENLDLGQMMESLEQAEFDEEQFRERLERALELFERLKTAQALDEAARRAEELAEREEALREATERLDEQQDGAPQSDPEAEQQDGEQQDGEQQDGEQEGPPQTPDPAAERERLAQEQEAAREAMQELEQQMQELQEQMENQQGAPSEQMQEMNEQMQQQDLPQQMEQNAQQLRQNQLSPAQEGQQQMSQQLQQMAQEMGAMAQNMMQGQQRQNLQGLRRVLDDVLTLSEEQERLGNETGALPSQSPALRALAQEQVELAEGLATVADSVASLGRKIPQMSYTLQEITHDAIREMGQSTERLAELQPGPASGHQKTAMTHLNELALLLSELMDQLSMQGQSSGQGSMTMPQMQQMLQQMQQGQQQLNGQIQQMLNDMAGERLTQTQQARARQAAAQQRAIREQLQELIERGGPSLDAQTRSALQRAADGMRAIERELRGGRLSQETLQRQQNILQRLLEAERSVNQRGREERREGETGRDRPDPDRPDRLDAPEGPADRLRRDLIRALESGYAPDYQDLIKRYFEQLQDRVGGS